MQATPLQSGMIFNSLAASGSGVDIEQVTISCNCAIDLDRFLESWNVTIARFSALRSVFNWSSDGTVFVEDVPVFEMPFEKLDWSTEKKGDLETLITKTMLDDRKKGFDLSAGVPMRLVASPDSTNRCWFLWSFHHSILDGRSFPLVLDAVFSHYHSDDSHGQFESPDIAEYSKAIHRRNVPSQMKFWERKLEPIESRCVFPELLAGNSSETMYAENHAYIQGNLDSEQSKSIRDFANENEVTVHTLVQAAWSLIIHHYTNNETVVFGDTRALRHVCPNTENAVGLMINTIPFPVTVTRTHLSDNRTIDLAREVSARATGAAPRQRERAQVTNSDAEAARYGNRLKSFKTSCEQRQCLYRIVIPHT